MKVEYLVVTQQDGNFCNSKSAFNNLLQADSQISVSKDKLKFTQESKTLEVEYNLETDEIRDKKQRYFHIKFTAEDESQIEIFTVLVRTIRKIIEKLNSNISVNTLWDDISKHYIVQAYPLINDVENVMRKLILKFMVINVGMDWVNETMPTSIKEKISEKAKKNKASNILEDILHNADFIQLAGFLFDKKRNKDFGQFDKLLEKTEINKTFTVEALRNDFLPVSNFDRYFSKVISYQGNLLEEKWHRLYELRNQIAHNKKFSKSELDEVKKLCDEIIGKLTETIDKLDKVELDEEQKENIFTEYTSPLNSKFIAETKGSQKSSDKVSSLRFTMYTGELASQEAFESEARIARVITKYLPISTIAYQITNVYDGFIIHIQFKQKFYFSHLEVFKTKILENLNMELIEWSPEFDLKGEK